MSSRLISRAARRPLRSTCRVRQSAAASAKVSALARIRAQTCRPDPLDHVASVLARLLDAHEVDWADGRPDLLAGGVAGDGDEALRAARLHTNVKAGELRVGVGIAGRARFEGADASVSKGLSHGSKRSFGLTVG